MSLRLIQLRKLLKIMYSEPNRRVAALRSDIRDDIARETGNAEGGGDFYGPFWRDAKDHVFGTTDLRETTAGRINNNSGRANLYPALRDGFLLWWDERRRWTNEPFRPADLIRAKYSFPEIDCVVKIDNILCVQDGEGRSYYVYPYFSPEPALGDEAARLALWIIDSAIPHIGAENVRILDVIRGRTFAIDLLPLRGNEEETFLRRYSAILQEWEELKQDYV